MPFGIKVNIKGSIEEGLKRLTGKVDRSMPATMDKIGDRMIKNVQKEVRRFAKKKNSTGKLEKSWEKKVKKLKRATKLVVFSRAPHAHIHETGGTIRPKRRQFLTIPLTEEARKKRPRRFGKKLFRPRGKSVLVLKQGNRIVPQYALKRRVRIKPKRYVTKAVKKTNKFIQQRIQTDLRLTLK